MSKSKIKRDNYLFYLGEVEVFAETKRTVPLVLTQENAYKMRRDPWFICREEHRENRPSGFDAGKCI